MKRFQLILLSLALVMAFCASAFAVDVKFSGSYYAAGMYLDKITFLKGGTPYIPSPGSNIPPIPVSTENLSSAFYYQRVRINTDVVVSPGLKLVTRFDVMERNWGAARSFPGIDTDVESSGTKAENENIAFDWAYVEYTSPVGLFMVGIQDDGGWGTILADTSRPQGIVTYAIEANGFIAALQFVKMIDGSRRAINPLQYSDFDMDKYQLATMYEWKTGKAGILGIFYRAANFRDLGILAKVYVLEPFVVANLGPVKVQAELDYAWGNLNNDNPGGIEFRVDNLVGWIDAGVDFKQYYFGGTFAYVSGNDWKNCDMAKGGVIRGGFLTGGMDWNPTLILFNNERQYWAGDIGGHDMTGTFTNDVSKTFGLNDSGMYNAWFFQTRAGVRPTNKLDINASVSYALADSKTLGSMLGPLIGMQATEAVSNEYGWEIDLTGTYKITDNLSYMLGGGYLFTGNYFKGSDPNNQVRDDFLILNKLTLTF